MTRYILDACIIIKLLTKEVGYEKVQDILQKARLQELELYMSVVNYGEISMYLYKNISSKAGYLIENLERLDIKLVKATKEQAKIAGYYKSIGGIAYPDCFVLALAKEYQAFIITSDSEFKKFTKDFDILFL